MTDHNRPFTGSRIMKIYRHTFILKFTEHQFALLGNSWNYFVTIFLQKEKFQFKERIQQVRYIPFWKTKEKTQNSLIWSCIHCMMNYAFFILFT